MWINMIAPYKYTFNSRTNYSRFSFVKLQRENIKTRIRCYMELVVIVNWSLGPTGSDGRTIDTFDLANLLFLRFLVALFTENI